MGTRKNTFLVKRSNIAGNVPAAGQLLLGELALNTADVKLYTSGTTSNSILPIGWDRISRTGDTMTGSFSAPTISATTYYNLPNDLPSGGTTGQILAKIDAINYNTEWIDNYTGQLKHIVTAGEFIVKGQAVYVSSSNGSNMIVSKASNNSEMTSSKTLGLLAQSLSLNQQGFVITEGLLAGLNTSTANAGDPVWLGVNGNLIYGLLNKPHAPAHLVFIGIVTRVQQNNGEIFVKVQNGFELDELHDVDLITTTPINGHVLGYNGTLWVNKTIAGWLGFTPANDANVLHTTGNESASGIKTFSDTTQSTSISSGAVIVGGGVGISKNLYVGGNLNLSGNLNIGGTLTTINAQNLSVSDNMIYLNNGIQTTITNAVGDGTNIIYTTQENHNYVSGMTVTISGINPSGYNFTSQIITSVSTNSFTIANSATGTYNSGGTARAKTSANPDLGFAGGYYDTSYAHAGLFRDATDNVWKFFKGYTPEPDDSPYIDTSHPTFAYADLRAFNVTGNSFIKVGGSSGEFLKADGSVDSSTYVPTSRTLSINGTSFDLSTNRSWVVPFVTANTFNNATYDLTISASDGTSYTSNLGLLSTDIKVTGGTYNINTGVITFTNSTGGTFNVTGFSSGMTDTFVTGGTYSNGTATFTRSNNQSFNVTGFNIGTVTSVAAITLGTSGTDLSSSVANGATTPVITLNVPTASASNRGALSSVDWSTFNSKQAQLNGTGFIKANGTSITYDNSTYYLASNPNGYTTNTGTVTQVNKGNGLDFSNFTTSGTITLGTPSSLTLSSTNAVTTNSHTHAFSPGGTTSQYITGAGTLVTFPTIPTVNNGTLTLATSGIATGSASFTANQDGSSTFTVNVPATDLSIGVSSGSQVRIDSSTGADASLPVASSTLAGVLTATDWSTFNSKQSQLNGTGFIKANGTSITYDNSSYYLASNPNGYISSYSETDTLNSVTTRGASTTNDITIGALTVGGSLSYGSFVGTSNYVTGADNILLKGNSGGVSGIFFESEKNGTNINHPSDFGFIQYHSYGIGGTSGEANRLVIGVSNDADDLLVLNPVSNNGLVVRVGPSTTEHTIWHAGNDGSGSGLDADTLDGLHASSFLTSETDTLSSVTSRGASTSTLSAFNGGLTAAKTAKNTYGIQIKGAFYGAPRLQLYDLAVDGNAFLGLGTDMSGGAYEFSNYFPRYSGYGRWSLGSWAGDFGTGQYVSGYNEKLWVNETSAAFNVPLNVVGAITQSGNQVWHAGNITPVPTARTITINGTTLDLSENRSFTVAGGVTSVAALTLGTSGTDLSSSVANGTTTPVITLNVPTASASNRGVLSSTDWSTFNNKQAQLNGTGFIKANGTSITYDNSTYYLASNPNGYISSFTETDPTVPSHVKAITTTSISNWNTAFGWGNHASAGYVPGGRTITINGTTQDLSANRSFTVTAAETDTLATVTSRGNSTTGNITVNGDLSVKNSLLSNQSNSVPVGTTAVFSNTLGSTTAAFFDYVVTSGSNARAGSVMVVINGGNVEFTETSTNDIGDTSRITLKPTISGGNIILDATSTSGTWVVKVLARLI
jgi:hypothetical protein